MGAAALCMPSLVTCSARSSSSERTTVDAGAAGAGPSTPDPIAALRPFEEETRRTFDFAKPPSAETGMGADPWAIHRIASGWVGVLRGRSMLVLLDDDLNEIARCAAPRSPTGLAIAKNGEVLVAGELSPSLGRFAVRGRTLVPLGDAHVPGVTGLRDVAVSPAGAIWALDERGGRLLRIGLDAATETRRGARILSSLAVGHGAAQILATAKHVVVDAITDHAILVFATDGAGRPSTAEPVRIVHDGPMWGVDARETDAGLIVAAGGVEDHPLDRKGGFFGFIDSFVFAYRVHEGTAHAIASVNVSEHGVVTPKALAVEAAEGDHVDLLVTAYGSASGARVGLAAGGGGATVVPFALVPGIRTIGRAGRITVAPDPLLDAWVAFDERGVRVVPVPPRADEPSRSTSSRLGEALFFTSLMAPMNTSEGAHSRFTCETCHFEGYVDGRTHHTGRDDVHATTKPLVGLVGNRPYFSRALDPDLSTIAHAEFRVAGAGSTTDPFFAVDPRDHGWLEHAGVHERAAPLELRQALMQFLTDLSHRPNPAVIGRTAFEPLEREGARLFRDRCEGCHAARLVADDPSTHIAFEQWEAFVLAESAPIVWGSAGYEKTGVTPYVHAQGARTPSLRRLYKKHPYFTNGSAKSIAEVLDAVRFVGADTFHAAPPDDAARLDDESKRALGALLELL